MSQFIAAVNGKFGTAHTDYQSLWAWSTDNIEDFWSFWWEQAAPLASQQPVRALLKSKTFKDDVWFPEAKLNFAENLLRFRDDKIALVFRGEDGAREELSYQELFNRAANVACEFQKLGLKPGDRVAAIMPNRPETIIAMLATSWLGAIWSSCSPDFGIDGILERFEQIEPQLLVAIDGYQFKGKSLSICDKVEEIQSRLNCQCILVNWQNSGKVKQSLAWSTLENNSVEAPDFYQLAFNDPLYILFSSGTTGKPKCIVHGVGGTLLQHLKEHRLHTDISREDILFYFTTCGWMMWNWLVSGLASGCTLVLYDGNPFYPTADTLMQIAEEESISVFGTSAKYLSALQKEEAIPKITFKLEKLKTILSTGSPLVPESFDYVYENIKSDVQLCSISGGTDIVSCFVLGNPLLPVFRGELQSPGLGMAVNVWNGHGEPVLNEPGELVCTKSFPAKPVYFWNDPDGSRYENAYFARFENVWCHGDWAQLTNNNGYIITGRSDAVLNPGGVRIGTAEIYRQVERIPEVLESIAVSQEWEGDVRIVLFVVLKPDVELSDEIESTIRISIRQHASPRHVPAKILQVADIPRTRSGKITELAVRDIINNRPITNTEALANPEALEYFRDRAELSS